MPLRGCFFCALVLWRQARRGRDLTAGERTLWSTSFRDRTLYLAARYQRMLRSLAACRISGAVGSAGACCIHLQRFAPAASGLGFRERVDQILFLSCADAPPNACVGAAAAGFDGAERAGGAVVRCPSPMHA